MPKPFTHISARAAPLLRDHVDTDAIIPSREIKGVSKTGLKDGLFAGWRYSQERTPNPDFVLNMPEYKTAKILLSGKNFGCGSSREHAVWALREYGFLAIIAQSYGEIFYANCINNGLLPVILPGADIQALAKQGKPLAIDLRTQTIGEYRFDIEPAHKHMLLRGLDAIDLTLEDLAKIEQFETRYYATNPWVKL